MGHRDKKASQVRHFLQTCDENAWDPRRKRAEPAMTLLERETYTNLDLGTGCGPAFYLGEVQHTVIIPYDNLDVTRLDTYTTAEVDVEWIADTTFVQCVQFLVLRAVDFSIEVVQCVLSGRLDKCAGSGRGLVRALAAECYLENGTGINEEVEITAEFESVIQVYGDIECKFPVGFPFVLKGTINGFTVVPSVKKGAEIHSGSNTKAGNNIEVVLAAQVKTIEVGLVVRISA